MQQQECVVQLDIVAQIAWLYEALFIENCRMKSCEVMVCAVIIG